MKHLKINLLQCIDLHTSLALEQKSDDYHAKTFAELKKGKEELTEADLEQLRSKAKSYASELGLSPLGEDYKNVSYIEKDSSVEPDHIFKIGTIIDVIGDMGISSVLGNLGIKTLHQIFAKQVESVEQEGGVSYVSPDWQSAHDACVDALSLLEKRIKLGNSEIVSTVALPLDLYLSPKLWKSRPVQSAVDALTLYHSQLEYARKKNINANYENSFGLFYISKALKIRAAIAGTNEQRGHTVPCSYLVYNTNMDWYVNGLKIVLEMIQYILSRPEVERKDYWLKFIL